MFSTPIVSNAMIKPLGKSRFRYEREVLQRGRTIIAGVDEAGRGPLAGPVVAAAVIFPTEWLHFGLPAELDGLNDSKQLKSGQRERFFDALTAQPRMLFAIASVDAGIVDQINILQATHRAMNDALDRLPVPPQHVLVDGSRVKSLRWPQTSIVRGDT